MNTHVSYETAKKLKEFLGESALEPMDGEYFIIGAGQRVPKPWKISEPEECLIPVLKLHDLLSKPFCEAFTDACEKVNGYCPVESNKDLSMELAYKNYFGGLPAVEKALCEMMEGK